MLGYLIDDLDPRLRERLRRLPRRSRAALRVDGPSDPRARLRARRDPAARARRTGQVDRTPPPGAGSRFASRQRAAPRRRGPRRAVGVPGGVSDRGPPGLPAALNAHDRRVDRCDPRGGRRRGLGAPVLGHLRAAGGARHHRPLPRLGARWRGVLLRHVHARADRAARRALRATRAAAHGLIGLSRSRATGSSRAFARSARSGSSLHSVRSASVSVGRSCRHARAPSVRPNLALDSLQRVVDRLAVTAQAPADLLV